jgi:hypothetical protein
MTLKKAEALVKRHQIREPFVEQLGGFGYRGFVFRGDTRHYDSIFTDGFQLRGEIPPTLDEVNGFRGGFGGGHDALDIDGKGISTSPFYRKNNTGAYFYGGKKGGYTYLIDARTFRGYDLYSNHNHIAHKGRSPVRIEPWEINYGRNIPTNYVIGAFDENDQFVPNPFYRKRREKVFSP